MYHDNFETYNTQAPYYIFEKVDPLLKVDT